jgi:hypothetical protein
MCSESCAGLPLIGRSWSDSCPTGVSDKITPDDAPTSLCLGRVPRYFAAFSEPSLGSKCLRMAYSRRQLTRKDLEDWGSEYPKCGIMRADKQGF